MLDVHVHQPAIRDELQVHADIDAQARTVFKHGGEIQRTEVENSIPSPVLAKIAEVLAEGESLYLKGSNIQAMLQHRDINPTERDWDGFATGAQTLARLKESSGKDELEVSYKLLETTVEGSKLEISDGDAIRKDIEILLADLVKQLEQPPLPYPPTAEKLSEWNTALEAAQRIVKSLSVSDDNLATINGFTTEKGIALKVSKVQGSLQFTVIDPHHTLEMASKLEALARNELGFIPERLSLEGISDNSIFRLILETMRVYDGQLDTKSWVALSTLKMISRIPKDAVNGLAPTADNLFGLESFRPDEGPTYTARAKMQPELLAILTAGASDFTLIRQFLWQVMQNHAFTGHTTEELTHSTGEVSLDAYIRKMVQKEMARCAHLNPEYAIFYFMSYLPEFAEFAAPVINDNKQMGNYHFYFDSIPQNSLADHLRYLRTMSGLRTRQNSADIISGGGRTGLLFAFDDVPYVRNHRGDLYFFENVIAFGEILYPLRLIHNGKTDTLPVIRPENRPENMSEVFAFMFYCLSATSEPSVELIERLCSQWTATGVIHVAANDNGFDRGVSPTKILAKYREISERIYRHFGSANSVDGNTSPFSNN